MVLRCLRAELMKCRRAPVWLAFLVLPLFPAVLGTFNYLGNLEVLDAGWYSLWTQHTLFASMFFLPAQFGVFCAWQWRLEHADHNWNAALTAPVPVRALYLGKLLLDVGVSALAMALIGLLIATVVNLFVGSSVLDWALTYLGVFIFTGLTAYDTQKIRNLMLEHGHEYGESTMKLALMGSLTLYLDFINLFLYLLRIFGDRK